MKKHLIIAVFVFTFLGFCNAQAGDQNIITWTGCGITKKAFMLEIYGRYYEKYGTMIKLSGGGATKGIRDVNKGVSDMGGTCRHLLGDDGKLHQVENDAKLTRVAWDAIVAVVNKDNPVDNISLAQLKQVLDGRITNWQQLGGPDKSINLILRKGKISVVGYMFRYLVHGDPDYTFKATEFQEVKSTGPLEKIVSKDKYAIGLDGISSAKRRAGLKILSLDQVAPAKENLVAGKYPLFRPLYIVTGPQSDPESQKVVDFILSREGQDIISNVGTVNLKEGERLEKLWQEKVKKISPK